MSTIIKRNVNKIIMLKDDSNHWVSDEFLLRDMAVDFYKNLYSEDIPSYCPLVTSQVFPRLHQELFTVLMEVPSTEEILKVIKSMGSYKAPGIDGFQPIFFQSQWPTIGPSVVKFILSFFNTGYLPQSLKETLLVLILKIQNPDCLANFRPISLCNVVYKIVTKIFANRIKPLMSRLVDENQSSFIAGLNAIDNVVIVQEVIHSMKRKTGKKGWMAIKIDLEKAYDRVNWDFVKESLILANFPANFIDRIMNCVCSPVMRLLWNGSLTEEFNPSRGLRQGDPISP